MAEVVRVLQDDTPLEFSSYDICTLADAFKRYFSEGDFLISTARQAHFRRCVEVSDSEQQLQGFRCLMLTQPLKQRQLLEVYFKTLSVVACKQAAAATACAAEGRQVRHMGTTSSVARCVTPGIFRKPGDDQLLLRGRKNAADAAESLRRESQQLDSHTRAVEVLIDNAASVFDIDVALARLQTVARGRGTPVSTPVKSSRSGAMIDATAAIATAMGTPVAPSALSGGVGLGNGGGRGEDAVGHADTINAFRAMIVDLAAQAAAAPEGSKARAKVLAQQAMMQGELDRLEGRAPATPIHSTATTTTTPLKIRSAARSVARKLGRIMGGGGGGGHGGSGTMPTVASDGGLTPKKPLRDSNTTARSGGGSSSNTSDNTLSKILSSSSQDSDGPVLSLNEILGLPERKTPIAKPGIRSVLPATFDDKENASGGSSSISIPPRAIPATPARETLL